MESIYHDAEHFAKCWQEYIERCDSFKSWFQWLDLVFDEELFDKVGNGIHLPTESRKSTTLTTTFKTLGIGCGSGKKHYDLMERFATRYPHISATVLEPLVSIHDYMNMVTTKGIAGVEWTWQQQTWEQFYDSMNIQRFDEPIRFHFISAVAVLYYLRNWQEAIMNMFDLLEPGGVLFITLNSGDCGFANIWTKFPMLSDDASNLLHIDQVTRFLRKKRIDYDVIEGISYIDISSCFKEGIDTKGDMLLDFLVHIKNFRKTAPPTLLAGFLDFLKGPECCKIDDDGRFMLNEGWGAIIVQKK